MKEIYLWGAGFWAESIYQKIDMRLCELKGIVDGDGEKQKKEWNHGLRIDSPEALLSNSFDYVVITPQKYDGILAQYLGMGLPAEKALVYWEDTGPGEIFGNRSLYVAELERKHRSLELQLENFRYEHGLEPTPKIKSGVELLKHILRTKCSLSRFGDGEFELMLGRNRPWFQKVDEQLGYRLREIITQKDTEKIVIAIADDFGDLSKYKEQNADDIRDYLSNNVRQEIMRFLDLGREYYDAYVSRPYIMYRNGENTRLIFQLFHEIWKGRSILLVEGKYAKMGVGNDLFSAAVSVKRIICPASNSWDRVDEIKSKIQKYANPDDLILVSLGPTATVIAYDLSAQFQVLDIGQLDNEYDWYLRGAQDRIAIPDKMVAEVGFDYSEPDSAEYYEQVVCRIE